MSDETLEPIEKAHHPNETATSDLLMRAWSLIYLATGLIDPALGWSEERLKFQQDWHERANGVLRDLVRAV